MTFTGKFPSTISANRVMLLVTPHVYDYGAVDAEILTASSTSITVAMYSWQSYTGTYHAASFYMALVTQP